MRSHFSKHRFHETMPIVFSIVDFPPFGFVLKPLWSIHMCFNVVMAGSCQKSFFKASISRNHAYRVLHSRFPPFGFVLKPFWSIHMCFNIVMADSCQKSFFKTSISRNHAYRVLHSRFPPFGFVLKPVWLIHMCFLIQLWRIRVRSHFSKHRFHAPKWLQKWSNRSGRLQNL